MNEGYPSAEERGTLPTMVRIFVFLSLSAVISCGNERPDLLGDAAPSLWPRCPEGTAVSGRHCVPEEGLKPCELVEAGGGCPTGYSCRPGSGCVAGVACGNGWCRPGETCRDGQCLCPGGPCEAGQVCGATRNDQGAIEAECVGPSFDGDDDGHPLGDVDGDGTADDCDDLDPAVAPGLEEVCDGKDNDCDGTADEGFDDDDDGYASCATAFWPADCADDDATIHPGAIDLCRLDGAGQLIDSDCRDDNDSCPPNGRCCPEQEGCVALDQDNQNCRACGSACGSEEYCFAGACHDEEATPQIEVADDQVPLTAGNGLSAHPALDWNWARRSAWLRWWEGSAEQWLQYPYWLVSYGIAWVHQEYGESRLVFARRQFVSAPVPRPAAASEAWDAVVAEVSEPLWSPATEVARLTTEDALPDLTAFEDLGYALVWSDGSDYQQVQITVIGADGGADGWSSQITNEQAHHHYPRIATSSAIEEDGPLVGVVYQREEAAQAGDEAGNMQVYFQSLRGLSERRPRFGPPVQLSYDEQGGLTPAITWTPIGFAVVWVNPAEANLYFALLNESGVPLVASQQVTFGGNVLPWRPSLAWHEGAERFGIAYQGSTPPDNEEDIYFQALDGYGTPRGSPVALTNYDGLQRRPVLAATDVGYAVAWEDEPTSLGEVHLVQLSLDGKVTQGPTTLSRQGGAGQVATPCLAFATLRDDHEGTVYSLTGWRAEVLVGTGELAAVWQDQPTSIEYSVINFLRLNEQ